jgi:dolichol kinase
MIRDLPILLLTYVYLFGMLGAAEGLRKWRGYPVDFTRKIVHIAAGMTAWLLLLFRTLPMALIPPVSFIFINLLSYRKGLFQSMETGERGNLGTIYFPISFSILTILLWEHRVLLVATMMPLTWGDALAAVVGQRLGRRKFQIMGSTRSLEGSLAFWIVAWVATAVPLVLLPGTPHPGWNGVLVSFGVATAAAIVEACTPWGLDNITVPAASALALWIAMLL